VSGAREKDPCLHLENDDCLQELGMRMEYDAAAASRDLVHQLTLYRQDRGSMRLEVERCVSS
jgi:hypothetical protein